MFSVLEQMADKDSKHGERLRLENYVGASYCVIMWEMYVNTVRKGATMPGGACCCVIMWCKGAEKPSSGHQHTWMGHRHMNWADRHKGGPV